MKKSIKFFIVFFIMTFFTFIPKVKAASINAEEITLYTFDNENNQYGVYMPEDLPKQFQIEVTDTNYIPEFTVEGTSVVVDENGLITPRDGSSSGSSEVKVIVADKTYTIKVNVVNYLDIWADEIIDNYIKNNITSSMSQYQKLEKICQFAVTYRYDTRASSYQEMLLIGGGDCWASAFCVRHMAQKLGMKAHIRYAVDDSGAGSNHRNAAVEADGEVYIVETSYNQEKIPRDYTIKKTDNGISRFWIGDPRDYKIGRQYDGFDEEIVLEPTYQGIGKIEYLTEIDYKLLQRAVRYSDLTLKKVTLPDTIEKIGEDAFSYCEDLTTINLPKNLKEITPGAFAVCPNLVNLNLDPENPYFILEDGILYNKDKTKIIFCLTSKKGKITIKDSVKEIEPYAFYKCKDIEGLYVPKTVEKIGEYAFAESGIDVLNIEDGCEATIGEKAFYDTVKMGAKIPGSVKEVGNNAFGKYTLDYFKFYVEENSPAMDYVKKQSLNKYELIDKTGKTITQSMLVVDTELDYTGKPLYPLKKITDGKKDLVEGKDYKVEYNNNVDSLGWNKNKFTVTGIGEYKGTVEVSFTINKVDYDFCFTIPSEIEYGDKIEPVVTKNPENVEIMFSYSEDSENAKKTNRVPTEIGSYIVYGTHRSIYNHNSKTIRARFKIVPKANELKISCENTVVGKQPKVTIIKNLSGGEITLYYKKQNEDDSKYTKKVPTTVGKYTVKAVSKATDKYAEGVATANFEIIEKPVFKSNDPVQFNKADEKQQIKAKTTDGKEVAVNWVSNKPDVISTENGGYLIPKSGGFVTLTAKDDTYGETELWAYVSLPITLSDGSTRYAGDLDGNGVIDVLDSSFILDIYRRGGPTPDELKIADINGDGIVDVVDSSYIQDIYKYGTFKIVKQEENPPTNPDTPNTGGEKDIEYTLGDVNQDGDITAEDAKNVLDYIAGKVNLTSVQTKAANVNGDNDITAEDAKRILDYIAGKIKNF